MKTDDSHDANRVQTVLNHLIIGIKGAGEMASAVALRLYQAHVKQIFMMDMAWPLAVRRGVSFSEAIPAASHMVENVTAVKSENQGQIRKAWGERKIAVAVDPEWRLIDRVHPDILIDAILAKRNVGTRMTQADLVIGLGPGFTAGVDVHLVIETNRGHNLGRIIEKGGAEPNTGIPGDIDGYTSERVLRSPAEGLFQTCFQIGNVVNKGDVIGTVNRHEVKAGVGGVIRGLLRPDTQVFPEMKLGDIDPRSRQDYCYSVSDKSRNISGAVLEAVMRIYNRHRKG